MDEKKNYRVAGKNMEEEFRTGDESDLEITVDLPEETQKSKNLDKTVDLSSETDISTAANSKGEIETKLQAPGYEGVSLKFAPGDFLLHYQIRRKIGSGGMGMVFDALDTQLKRRVAIKTLHARLVDNREILLRFRREAQALAQVRHPNVVQIYGLHQDRGVHFFAMEFIKGGESLKDYLLNRKYLDEQEAISLIIQIARGLQAIHNAGLIHRDIKPANIMLDKKIPRIADFGIARWSAEEMPRYSTMAADKPASTDLTVEGKIIGTPGYLAPECFSGIKASFASDIYALGVIFYEMLSGQKMVEARSLQEIAMAHLTKKTPMLHTVYKRVSRELSLIVAQMTDKEPSARYQKNAEIICTLSQLRDSWKQAREEMVRKELKTRIEAKANTLNLKRIAIVSLIAIFCCLALVFRLKETLQKMHEELPQAKAPGNVADDTVWKEGCWTRVCGMVVEDFVDADPVDEKGKWLIINDSNEKCWVHLSEEFLAKYPGLVFKKGEMFAFQGIATRGKAGQDMYANIPKEGFIDWKNLELSVLNNGKYEGVLRYERKHLELKGKLQGSILDREIDNQGLWLVVGKPTEDQGLAIEAMGVQLHNEMLWNKNMTKSQVRIGDILDIDGIIRQKTVLLPEAKESEVFYLDVAAGMYCQIFSKAAKIQAK